MTREFSWPAWFAGFAITFFVGAILNVVAGVFALGIKIAIVSGLVGAAPGLILAATSQLASPKSFAYGALTAACFIALVGGICGASLSGARIAG